MTRDEFISGYMARSECGDYRVEGERVHWEGGMFLALPCRCGDPECEGWAMVPPSGRNWHLFQNTEDSGMTGQEAMAADLAFMKAEAAA